jgi:argininosuccinate synthase
MPEKIVLAYSGGLDTSVAIRWLKEERGYDVVALTVDVGMDRSREELQSRAMAAGASAYVWRDAQETFIRHFAFPALLRAPATRAITRWLRRSRPLIAREMVAVAKAEGATAVAHGCTGKETTRCGSMCQCRRWRLIEDVARCASGRWTASPRSRMRSSIRFR